MEMEELKKPLCFLPKEDNMAIYDLERNKQMGINSESWAVAFNEESEQSPPTQAAKLVATTSKPLDTARTSVPTEHLTKNREKKSLLLLEGDFTLLLSSKVGSDRVIQREQCSGNAKAAYKALKQTTNAEGGQHEASSEQCHPSVRRKPISGEIKEKTKSQTIPINTSGSSDEIKAGNISRVSLDHQNCTVVQGLPESN
ncbi:unnamed protein product [Dibothriocephalus latus]|uniref:Uncharacterized protein n=1 Tax=Dibothriocephalus latus TaxID=60516 RepID=A0A3P6PJJ3_DIBLA|nr:unnamed protein product [Dibothriocephalus latus]